MTRRRGREGFTLLEVLVAVTVASVVALLLHQGFREVLQVQRRAAEHRAAAARSAAVRRQIAGWLRGVYVHPTSDRSFDGEDGGRRGAKSDRLEFWTSTAGWGRTGSLRIGFGVEPGTGLVATVNDRGVGNDSTARRILLVPEAERMELRYYLPIDGRRIWVNSWSSAAQLPEAVEVRISGRRVPPLLRAPMLVALHAG